MKAMRVNAKAASGAGRQWGRQVEEAGRCWGEEVKGGEHRGGRSKDYLFSLWCS